MSLERKDSKDQKEVKQSKLSVQEIVHQVCELIDKEEKDTEKARGEIAKQFILLMHKNTNDRFQYPDDDKIVFKCNITITLEGNLNWIVDDYNSINFKISLLKNSDDEKMQLLGRDLDELFSYPDSLEDLKLTIQKFAKTSKNCIDSKESKDQKIEIQKKLSIEEIIDKACGLIDHSVAIGERESPGVLAYIIKEFMLLMHKHTDKFQYYDKSTTVEDYFAGVANACARKMSLTSILDKSDNPEARNFSLEITAFYLPNTLKDLKETIQSYAPRKEENVSSVTYRRF